MNFIKNNSGVIAVIALVIAVIGVFTPVGQKVVKSFGAIPQNCGGSVTCFTEVAANNVWTTAISYLGGSTGATAIGSQASIGSCTGATSTPISLANPFAATSTVTIRSVVGVSNATSTTFQVGTSTKASLGAVTDISSSMINTTLSTTSQFTLSSGINAGSIGQVPAGSGTLRTILVGPNDFVVAWATSSAVGYSTNYTPGLSSCSYKIEWNN